jgi:Cu/Ag efflux pump CusA
MARAGAALRITMPIKARVDMLSTGIRTPVGIKILGPDLSVIEGLGTQIENIVNQTPHTLSVFADKVNTGYYLDIVVNRRAAARYGLTVRDVETIVESAVGGQNLTTTIEGRERYPVNVRYPRELRQDVEHTFWLLYLLGYNLSIAVWVGVIALAGLDAETGVVMLLYLNLAYKQYAEEGRLKTRADLNEAIMHGAVKRIRPKIMTVAVILAGLAPVMFSTGAGSDVMKRIAAPMIGGVVTSTILELLIYPAIFALWKGRGLAKADTGDAAA